MPTVPQRHDETTRDDRDERREDQRKHDFADAVEIEPIRADGNQHGADDAADQRMGGTRRQREPPGEDIP